MIFCRGNKSIKKHLSFRFRITLISERLITLALNLTCYKLEWSISCVLVLGQTLYLFINSVSSWKQILNWRRFMRGILTNIKKLNKFLFYEAGHPSLSESTTTCDWVQPSISRNNVNTRRLQYSKWFMSTSAVFFFVINSLLVLKHENRCTRFTIDKDYCTYRQHLTQTIYISPLPY